MAPSSSGPGRWPFTPEIAGSNPAGVTIKLCVLLFKLFFAISLLFISSACNYFFVEDDSSTDTSIIINSEIQPLEYYSKGLELGRAGNYLSLIHI